MVIWLQEVETVKINVSSSATGTPNEEAPEENSDGDNNLPAIKELILDQAVKVNELLNIDLNKHFMDIDGEPLTYEVSLDDEVAANAWVTTKGIIKVCCFL
jgi:hypothetical protein